MPVAILTTIPSDSHNWNLIFMELFLKEQGYEVISLGACVPFNLTLEAYYKYQPRIIVVSTINGHGFIEGGILIKYLKENLPSLIDVYIGGKLSTDAAKSALYASELEKMGYKKAYSQNNDLIDFKRRLKNLIRITRSVELTDHISYTE